MGKPVAAARFNPVFKNNTNISVYQGKCITLRAAAAASVTAARGRGNQLDVTVTVNTAAAEQVKQIATYSTFRRRRKRALFDARTRRCADLDARGV
jgi:hypothetical protein